MSATAQMTAEEFLALPEDPYGRRAQLIDGELVMNEPTRLHGHAQKRILFALETWIRCGDGRGEVCLPLDVRLDGLNVYGPDLAWYRDGRVPDVAAQPPYPVPDLVVEVRSRSTWRFDKGAKKAGYERSGVAELWLVDTTAAVVHAFRRADPKAERFAVSVELGAGETLTSALLPGFALAVGAIFAR